jgi:hypothetical protein
LISAHGLKGSGADGAILDSRKVVAAKLKQVADRVVGGQKALRLPLSASGG